jgi:hypothetical protein
MYDASEIEVLADSMAASIAGKAWSPLIKA